MEFDEYVVGIMLEVFLHFVESVLSVFHDVFAWRGHSIKYFGFALRVELQVFIKMCVI